MVVEDNTEGVGEPVLVALDFTADELSLLFTDMHGAPLDRGAWPLPPLPDADAWSWEVGGRIAMLFAAEGSQGSALAIAVAAPGVVDPLSGTLVHSTGQDTWDGLAVVEALRRHIDTPIACESRINAALIGERWRGVASGAADVLYVSLRGTPEAALLSGGRPVRGARFSAGNLPAMPELEPGQPIGDEDLETASGLLADASALLGPELVVIDGEDEHTRRLIPLLQRVLDEVAPGPRVVASELGDNAALLGAARLASRLAYEGDRKP